MAIYTQDPEGKITLVQTDMSLSDVIATLEEEKILKGEEVSPCFQDTLNDVQVLNQTNEEVI